MAEKKLDSPKGYSPRYETRGERVTKKVPADETDASSFA